MRKSLTTSFSGLIARILLLGVLVAALWLPGAADAAITRVQSATGDTGAAAATTIPVTLGAAPANGNTLIAVIATRGTTANRVTSITQTNVTNWSRVTTATNATGSTIEIWYAPNVSGAGTAITINQASLFSAAVVIEYNGLLTPASVDVSATSTGTSTAASTGTTITTTLASEVAVAGVGLVSSGYTLGTPTNAFTVVGTDNSTSGTATSNAKVYAMEKMLSATGTVTTGGTVSTSSAWSGAVATFKERPPVPGTVSVTPSASGYIGPNPTITTAFTSSWALSGCQYTTNGSTWSTGTVSGSAPNFTCTANPTGLSGTLTINMQASSNSTGTGTATAVSRTVDTAAPTDGALTLYPGNPDVGVLWGSASDAGSGLNHYDLYYQAGSVAPACGAGTLLYTGRNINYTHSGLPANTTYSYRVCATDNVGNVSTGAFGTATTTARHSTVNSCTACHGYPPVDNASRVGGTTGQFQGSHNKHVGSYGYDCTVCHVSNTTFSHSNGNLAMSSPINGNTGASYSKGASFAVSNAFTPGYCSNTYCHSNGTSVSTGTIVANNSPNWGSGPAACSACHGFPPQYRSGFPKMNNHTTARGHKTATCDVCHSSVTYSGGTYTIDPTLHNQGSYSLNASLGYTFATTGGTCSNVACHGPTPGTWGGHLGCVDCHSKPITRTKGRVGDVLDAVTTEFGLAWGHKKSGRTAVTDADCCVCHLEGTGYGTANKPSAYHQDGNIDLRDPDGQGEVPIKNVSGTAFTFQRFSTSFQAGSRSSNGHLSDTDIANVITQKFCLACHDSNGATNGTAMTAGGGPFMPWGGINLGANYTVANGAAAANGLVDVKTQMATTNSSKHPVLGPRNLDFPLNSRLADPYKTTAGTRVAAGGTKVTSVVINCFDCHNIVGANPLTLRTVAAHGNAVTLRGSVFVSGSTTDTNLCYNCHTGYTVSQNHGSGSAFTSSTDSGMTYTSSQCYRCHASVDSPVRPVRAMDVHGNNALATSTGATGRWSTGTDKRPYAFIRNTANLTNHSPKTVGGVTQNPIGCTMICGSQGAKTYTVGGSY